jgi:hypothetical protein
VKTPLQTEAEFFRLMLSHNLNHIILFHNSLQALLRERLHADAATDPMLQRTITLYDKMNSANSLLIALGFLDEMLILFWRRCFPGKPIPAWTDKKRHERLWKELGLNLGKMPSWSTLQDARKIRHCLLHANGRISLMRNPKEIRACIKRYDTALEEHLDRVVVTSHFLQRCVVAIRELRDQMLKGLTAHAQQSGSTPPP